MSYPLRASIPGLWDIYVSMNKRKKRISRKSRVTRRRNRILLITGLLGILTFTLVVWFKIFLPTEPDNDSIIFQEPIPTIEQEVIVATTPDSLDKSDDSSKLVSSEKNSKVEEVNPEPSKEEILENKVNEKLAKMSLEEKIYQLFVTTPEMLTGVSQVVAAGDTTKKCLEKTPIGGLIYLASNFENPDQTRKMLSNTQEYAYEIEEMPLFLCVDEEGGRITRIAQKSVFGVEKVGSMAEVTDKDEAYRCGEVIGDYLSDLGINVDFAPDADVLSNSNNTVIGDRSFGSDPQEVSEFAKAYSDGLHAHGVMSTYKHFPGHGATEADTHKGYAYTEKTYEDLLNNELIPFSYAEDNGVDMVMISHISLPNVIGDDTPSTLSYKVTTEILRNDLSYTGIVITDALNMGAITEKYGSSEAAVLAFKAGADLLLMPGNLEEAYKGISDAIESGEITEERLDESLRRIIRAKILLTE